MYVGAEDTEDAEDAEDVEGVEGVEGARSRLGYCADVPFIW